MILFDLLNPTHNAMAIDPTVLFIDGVKPAFVIHSSVPKSTPIANTVMSK